MRGFLASNGRRRCGQRRRFLPTPERPGALAQLAPKFAAYGLGWALRDYRGRKLVGHTGGVAGFVSRVMLVPEEKLGVVILTNAEEDNAFDAILFHVLDSYFGSGNTDWIGALREAEESAERMPKKNEETGGRTRERFKAVADAWKYAGKYEDAWYGAGKRFEWKTGN